MLSEILSLLCLIILIVLLRLSAVEKKNTIDLVNKAQEKVDNKIENMRDEICKNQNDLSNSILYHAKETNKRLLENAIQTSREQERLKEIISDDYQSIKNQIDLQSSIIEKIVKDNELLRKKLEVFTEIGSDSKQLNETQDFDEQENILKKALLEIEEDKKTALINSNTGDQEKISEQEIVKLDDFEKISGRDELPNDSSILDEDQHHAYSLMEDTDDNYFVTGKAGTGKSFLLNLFVRGTRKTTLKVAPTGIAALNIGGATIHSTFGFHNLENLDVEAINAGTIRLKSEKELILREVNTIIIDEISMVRADTFDKIDHILRVVNKNNRLFGGKQIIVFGDLFQLPPIAKRNEEIYLKNKYGGIFFFFSNAFKKGRFNFIELETNHRHKQDARFFDILNRMREGTVNDEDISIINQRVTGNDEELRRVVRLFPKKDLAERVNNIELDKIPAYEYKYDACIVYNKYNNQNINIESNYPITATLKLKLGTLIMMVNNDLEGRWVNGTLGIISFINKDIIKVKINDIEYEVFRCVFESREATLSNGRISYEVVLQVEQYPIVLAYAITIHKSQGMTYQRIACDITECFAPGQAYVALSRCSSLNGINLLSAISSARIAVDSDAKNFYISAKENNAL